MSAIKHALLVEVAWEVCNQVGGIYTVIRSKVPSIVNQWGNRYCLMGPYVANQAAAMFEPTDDYDDPFGQAVLKMREMGLDVRYGTWLISGRPQTVLFNLQSIGTRLSEAKYILWERFGISTENADELANSCLSLGEMSRIFLSCLAEQPDNQYREIIAQFHEWMSATSIPQIRYDNLRVKVVFTTHATMLGRYLAMNDPMFYDHLPFYSWERESKHFGIDMIVRFERAAAHGSHVFTTVSDVTSRECEYLLGRKPDVITPNGLNIQRFTAMHEIQNLHQKVKDVIGKFVMGHFFQSYSFNLDKTLFFFTSGRFEYKNKGFDLTMEALSRLNWRLKQEGSDMTVIMFFITKKPTHSVNPDALNTRAVMEEINKTCEIIAEQVRRKLFAEVAVGEPNKFPDLNALVEDQWKLRLRRNLQAWRNSNLPSIVTHLLKDEATDDILEAARRTQLFNHPSDPVKIVYHPDFLSPTNPFFGIDYTEFVRGCHLGVFPSYYEPWGYTPLEALASGVAAVTSDLAGFGEYVKQNIPNPDENGVYVVDRYRKSFETAAAQLTDVLHKFVLQTRRDRIEQRYRAEATSLNFDWNRLVRFYEQAYRLAVSE